jgi:hypothetical protein
MSLVDFLMQGDPTVQRLTSKYLLNQDIAYIESGYIKRYLDLFDMNQKMWGGGVYSPKWISTHYTMLELKHLEIDPKHPIYHLGLETLLHNLWQKDGVVNQRRHQDLCVVGMLISLASYKGQKDNRIHEMIDYLLGHQIETGGFNCMWETKPTIVASVHATLTILEGFRDYLKLDDDYRLVEVKRAVLKAEEVLLKRELYKKMGTNEPIHPFMVEPHYPNRWKYDILRALRYFVSVGHPYDERMKDAINILVHQMKDGKLPKGEMISGLIHFNYKDEGRLNTLHFLEVLKMYRPNLYERLMESK